MNKTTAAYITSLKKVLITTISWTLLISPIAVNAQQAQEAQEKPQQAQEKVDHQSANYCYQEGTNKQCKGGLVYNCHLDECVAPEDNKNYNMEYEKCGGNEKCREDLKADAKEFTKHKTQSPEDGNTQTLNYLSAAAMTGMGCVLLASESCNMDGIGALLTGALILASVLQAALGSGYKDKFESAKKEIEKLERNDEKGWNHTLQLTALETEVRLLGDMESAASEKIKHHQRTMVMITIAGVLAALCVALSYFGCPEEQPCTWWTVGLAVVALLLEQQAMSVAKKAKKSASEAKEKTNRVLAKLRKRYNDQYSPSSSSTASAQAGQNAKTSVESVDTASNDQQKDQVSEEIRKVPEVNVKMGVLGGNGENFANVIGYGEVEDAYNKTRKTGDASYINNELDMKAAKVNKAARRVLESLAKNKKTSDKAKRYINAMLDPAGNKEFIAQNLARNVSPIEMALSYRKGGGSDAESDIKKNSAKQEGLAYDANLNSGSKDYLKKLKAQLGEFENLMDDDTNGALAMEVYDPTVSQKAIDQLNGEKNKNGKDTIHPDSGLSLWKIITNRYNIIKLKKGF